jgi:L-lactate dehydrogenase complex protein LldG
MEDSTTSKEKILKKVRAALIHKSRIETTDADFDSNIYDTNDDPLELVFAQAFTDAGGQFVFCESEADFIDNFEALTMDGSFGKIWCGENEIAELIRKAGVEFSSDEKQLAQVQTAVTGCELLVARTGSIAVSSRMSAGRKSGVFIDYHIVIARTSQLTLHLRDALKELKTKYADGIPSQITFITGPSRSADIEKTLVQGAHGAKEIYLFLIDDAIGLNV